MVTSTPGRMPVIAFSDDADYDTLDSVLGSNWNEADQDWNGPEVYVPLDDIVQIIVL